MKADEVQDFPGRPRHTRQEVPARELGADQARYVPLSSLLLSLVKCVYTLADIVIPDIPVILPADDTLTLDTYLGTGLQPGETELPEDAPGMSLPSLSPISQLC